MTVVYIILALIIVIGMILFFRKREPRTQEPELLPDPGPTMRETGTGDSAGAAAYNEKAAIMETYPVLRDIPFVSPGAGVFPLTSPMVDAGMKMMLVSQISNIPVGTPSLSLLSLLQNPESNTREVISLVSTNPSFSAKVLQTVNSAYFRQTEKVTSIGRAITLLGYNNVRTLVLEDLLGNSVPAIRDRDRESYAMLWTHSAVVSAAASHIGRIFHLPEYTLGTIGLLHDIGKFFLDAIFRPDGDGQGFVGVVREDRQYGINHAVIGGIIAEQWRLPHLISDCVEQHHAPCFVPPEQVPDAIRKYCAVVCLADLISNVMGMNSPNPEYVPLRAEYQQVTGFTGSPAGLVTAALAADMEKARQTVRSYMKAS